MPTKTRTASKKAAAKKAGTKSSATKQVGQFKGGRTAVEDRQLQQKAAEKKAAATPVNTAEVKQSAEQQKQKAFDELKVPAHRRGQNLHEQNPDLATDWMKEQLSSVNEDEG